MRELELQEDAEGEMLKAAFHYEGEVSGLGSQFLDEVEEGFHRIRRFPLRWPIYEGPYRRCLLKRFPYGFIYRIESERIYVIAVAHLHRKPGYWTGRQ